MLGAALASPARAIALGHLGRVGARAGGHNRDARRLAGRALRHVGLVRSGVGIIA